MRPFITLLLFLFLGAQVQAQITIERSDFTLEEGLRAVSWDIDYSNASIPEEGEGMVWDFSALPLEEGSFTDYLAASSAELPEANLKEAVTRGILGGVAQRPGHRFHLLDDTGHGRLGGVYEPAVVPMAALTGGATDTLKALETVEVNMERESIIQFPLNYGDSWSYDNNANADFLLTVAAFGLQDTPAGQITRDSAGLSVAGYGTLILPNPSGIGSASVEVLMVKRVREVTFTYTLGGQPAPQTMLDVLGLEQGERQNLTRYFFYAKGLPRSAANIGVDGEGNITSFTISDEVKNVVSSTSQATAAPVQLKSFPSPVSAGAQLSIQAASTIQNGNFELFDAYGRQVATWPVDAVEGEVFQYTLPANLQAGMYMYRITEKHKEVRGIGKLHVVR